jgi:hypothetical protein
MPARQEGRRNPMRLRRIVYTFGWLAALVMAVGAGWKNAWDLFELFDLFDLFS